MELKSTPALFPSPAGVKEAVQCISSTLLPLSPPTAQEEQQQQQQEEEDQLVRPSPGVTDVRRARGEKKRMRRRHVCHEAFVNCLVVALLVICMLIFFARQLVESDRMYDYLVLIYGRNMSRNLQNKAV